MDKTDTSVVRKGDDRTTWEKLRAKAEGSFFYILAGAIVMGFLGGVFYKSGHIEELEARVDRLQGEVTSIERQNGDYRRQIAEKDRRILELESLVGDPPDRLAQSLVHVDDPEITPDVTVQVRSPILITWDMQRNMVVHIYEQGRLIFPARDPHQEHSSGVRIPLDPGRYEVKLWVPAAHQAYKSVWVEIRDN